MDCDTKYNDRHIFNHFDTSEGKMKLVAECRSISAQAMAGFTCGSNPTLESGTRVVVPNVPETYYTDDRKVTILKEGDYSEFEKVLATYKKCPYDDPTCDNISFFQRGCASTRIENGLVVFEDAFHQPDCMPEVDNHEETDSWVEEHKIFIGYNDLVQELPGGLEAKLDIHKFYEISCNIRKVGNVAVGIETYLKTDNEIVNATIGTNFYIEKYFGDITDDSTRRELGETDVIPFSPNADPNDRFQFKVYSDHAEEYVHLESCKVSLDGDAFEQEFINDGCVTTGWENYFANENRATLANEDWFNMRPLLIGCKSKWHIDCTVASCKRGLENSNYGAYEQFCKADEECKDRYTAAFMGVNVHGRRRRSPDQSDENPAEDHVVMDVVHPCFYVDEQNTEYCVNERTCWNLEQCTAAFPDDFSNSEVSELDEIMKQFKEAVQEHIDEVLSSTESPINTHDHIMESIRENASRVVDMKQTFDDAVNEIIRLIQSL